MISVVILTYNEAANLPRCLASIDWCDDVLVVDSGSTDGTRDIARSAGARVLQRPFDNFAGQRNYAHDQGNLRYEWVLHLDADEEVTLELLEAMHSVIGSANPLDGYRIPARILFMGRWLKHAGMYPCYQVRFGHRDLLRFHQVGHGQRENLTLERVGTLDADLIHHNFSKGVSDWFIRHARYARDEAKTAYYDDKSVNLRTILWQQDIVERRRAIKRLAMKMPLRPLIRFIYVYVLKCGFLDGRAGFRYSLMLAIYEYMISLNLHELEQAEELYAEYGEERTTPKR
ncbi:MAG: glycosyltransferase family 2 protein [Gammaproteobacteria bacterium]